MQSCVHNRIDTLIARAYISTGWKALMQIVPGRTIQSRLVADWGWVMPWRTRSTLFAIACTRVCTSFCSASRLSKAAGATNKRMCRYLAGKYISFLMLHSPAYVFVRHGREKFENVTRTILLIRQSLHVWIHKKNVWLHEGERADDPGLEIARIWQSRIWSMCVYPPKNKQFRFGDRTNLTEQNISLFMDWGPTVGRKILRAAWALH